MESLYVFSVTKGVIPINGGLLHALHYITPSVLELKAMYHVINKKSKNHCSVETESIISEANMDEIELNAEAFDEGIKVMAEPLLKIMPRFGTILVTLGSSGVARVWLDQPTDKVLIEKYPAINVDNVINTTGCGDTFVGGLAHGLLEGKSISECIKTGIKMASLTACEEGPVSKAISTVSY